MTHRLFVALALPRPVREALTGAMGGIAGARWQADDQLHCTVRFLGEIDARMAEDAAAALSAVRHTAIDARLEGGGTFDRAGRIDTLWIGVEPAAPLRALHAKVDRALVRVGVGPDPRAYRPHVTIARFGGRMAPPPGVAAAIATPRLSVRFDEMRLYESLLGHNGARYEIVERYPLGRTAARSAP